jgi:hypothetical protein
MPFVPALRSEQTTGRAKHLSNAGGDTAPRETTRSSEYALGPVGSGSSDPSVERSRKGQKAHSPALGGGMGGGVLGMLKRRESRSCSGQAMARWRWPASRACLWRR